MRANSGFRPSKSRLNRPRDEKLAGRPSNSPVRYPAIKEDIRLVEATRKVVGDDYGGNPRRQQSHPRFVSPKATGWELTRAVETAKEYQRMKVYWLEEPLPRYDFDGLAELDRLIEDRSGRRGSWRSA